MSADDRRPGPLYLDIGHLPPELRNAIVKVAAPKLAGGTFAPAPGGAADGAAGADIAAEEALSRADRRAGGAPIPHAPSAAAQGGRRSVKTEIIPIELIDDSDRIRPVDPDWASVMAEDLAAGVALPPVLLRTAAHPEIRPGARFALVIGGHRMAAHRLAGSTTVRADIEEMTRAEARIREVDENLKRHELNALDRAVMLLERKRAWEEAYPETSHGRAPKPKKRSADEKSQTLRLSPVRFSADVANRIGLGERTIQADIELAAALAPDAIAEIRRTDLIHNAAELRRLAAHPAEDQVAIASDIAAGNSRNVAQALVSLRRAPPTVLDAQDQIFAKLVELYGRANARTKRRFEEHAGLVVGSGREGRS